MFRRELLEVQVGVWCAGFQLWLRCGLPLLKQRESFALDVVLTGAKIHLLLIAAQTRVDLAIPDEDVAKKSVRT